LALEQREQDLLLPDDVALEAELELLEALLRPVVIGPLRRPVLGEQCIEAVVVVPVGVLDRLRRDHGSVFSVKLAAHLASERMWASRSRNSAPPSPSAPARWKAGMAVSAR